LGGRVAAALQRRKRCDTIQIRLRHTVSFRQPEPPPAPLYRQRDRDVLLPCTGRNSRFTSRYRDQHRMNRVQIKQGARRVSRGQWQAPSDNALLLNFSFV